MSQYALKPAFILPTVLFVISALLILAVGLLLNIGLERHSARSYVDYQRAELAATAGLQQIEASLRHATSNDTFLVLESICKPSKPTDRQPAPHLFIAQGRSAPNHTFIFSYEILCPFLNFNKIIDSPGLANSCQEFMCNSGNQQIGYLKWLVDSGNVQNTGISFAGYYKC